MFFSISKTNKDPRFNICHTISKFKIHLDSGWEKINKNNMTIFYKGYCDIGNLEEIAVDFFSNSTPKYTGNFCIILIENNKVTITHDINRAFPLKYYGNNIDILTNLPYSEGTKIEEHVWSDSFIEYTENGMNKKFLENHYKVNISNGISFDECKNNITELLIKKANNLNHHSNALKIFLSGGVDTTMVYSLIKKCCDDQKNVDIITKEFFDFTKFTIKNMDTLMHNQSMWGYKQFHHWKEKTIYATGGMGDEIFMRGPTTASLWCAWNNINLLDELKSVDYAYHKKYFLLNKNKKIIEDHWKNRKKIQKEFPTYFDLCHQICNIVSNDHQHWHLENTISWTPLKDIQILKNMLCLSSDNLLDQIIHASMDKKIISELCPGMENYICTHKNNDQYNNLIKYPPFLEKLNNA